MTVPLLIATPPAIVQPEGPGRWVRKARRIYEFSSCHCCGTCWGGYPEHRCPVTTCLACGSAQCMGNGLGRGQCSICCHGLLPGWSGNPGVCGYAGCGQPAVFGSAPRVGRVCPAHLSRCRIYLGPHAGSKGSTISALDYIAREPARRSVNWEWIDQ